MVEESQTVLHYAGGEVTLPSVIKLVKFVRIHVIPRSRGGGHNWENVVSACHKCNHHKADKTLKEIGWKLRTLPREPAGAAWRILGSGKPDSRWITYLTPFGAESEVVA